MPTGAAPTRLARPMALANLCPESCLPPLPLEDEELAQQPVALERAQGLAPDADALQHGDALVVRREAHGLLLAHGLPGLLVEVLGDLDRVRDVASRLGSHAAVVQVDLDRSPRQLPLVLVVPRGERQVHVVGAEHTALAHAVGGQPRGSVEPAKAEASHQPRVECPPRSEYPAGAPCQFLQLEAQLPGEAVEALDP
eukprot:15458101-Alexandrium_andersonii.AAC.1